MSQIFGLIPDTDELSHKLDKSIINVIFAFPSDLKVLFSPSFMLTVRHPWIGAAYFSTVRNKERFCNTGWFIRNQPESHDIL